MIAARPDDCGDRTCRPCLDWVDEVREVGAVPDFLPDIVGTEREPYGGEEWSGLDG